MRLIKESVTQKVRGLSFDQMPYATLCRVISEHDNDSFAGSLVVKIERWIGTQVFMVYNTAGDLQLEMTGVSSSSYTFEPVAKGTILEFEV